MTTSFRTHKIELSGIESLKTFQPYVDRYVPLFCRGGMPETFPDMQTSETVEFFGFDTRKGLRSSLKFECR